MEGPPHEWWSSRSKGRFGNSESEVECVFFGPWKDYSKNTTPGCIISKNLPIRKGKLPGVNWFLLKVKKGCSLLLSLWTSLSACIFGQQPFSATATSGRTGGLNSVWKGFHSHPALILWILFTHSIWLPLLFQEKDPKFNSSLLKVTETQQERIVFQLPTAMFQGPC